MSDKEQEEKKDQKTKRQAGIFKLKLGFWFGFLDMGIGPGFRAELREIGYCTESTSA